MLSYDIVDVFTDRPFAGNQLAVVHGADDLSAEQCVAIAREFNFSETTFPSSEVKDGKEYATRIFTPAGEIPFAGHPTLGTAWVLREHGKLTAPDVTQICGAGRIGVRFDAADGTDTDGTIELSASPRDLLGPLDDDLVRSVLEDLGLSVADLAGPVWAAGCGLTFVHLPVVRDAVSRAVPAHRPLHEHAAARAVFDAAQDPVEGINLFHVSGAAPDLAVHSRVFVPGLSVPEDPATGSAAAGLGVALVVSGQLPDGGTYEISQGVEMGRPSSLHGRVETTVVGGHGWSTRGSDVPCQTVAAVCHVAGLVQPIARGEIAVPAR